MATVFETKSCSRCGGSGKYSFNQMDGDRCYGCGGTGIQLTERGVKAKEFYIASLETPVSEVKVGMFVFVCFGMSTSRRWWKVTNTENGNVTINSKRYGYFTLCGYESLPAAQDEAERQVKIEAALAYQNTL